MKLSQLEKSIYSEALKLKLIFHIKKYRTRSIKKSENHCLMIQTDLLRKRIYVTVTFKFRTSKIPANAHSRKNPFQTTHYRTYNKKQKFVSQQQAKTPTNAALFSL